MAFRSRGQADRCRAQSIPWSTHAGAVIILAFTIPVMTPPSRSTCRATPNQPETNHTSSSLGGHGTVLWRHAVDTRRCAITVRSRMRGRQDKRKCRNAERARLRCTPKRVVHAAACGLRRRLRRGRRPSPQAPAPSAQTMIAAMRRSVIHALLALSAFLAGGPLSPTSAPACYELPISNARTDAPEAGWIRSASVGGVP